MPLDGPRDWRPGDPAPSAEELNLLKQVAESGARSYHGLGSYSDAYNVGVGPTDTLPFWVKVTSNDGGSPPKHAWTEQQEDASTGVFADRVDGMTGTTTALFLLEVNGQTVPTGKVVRAYKGAGDFYLARYDASSSGSNTLTVEYDDGTGAISAVSPPLLKVTPAISLSGTGGAGGYAQLDLQGAYQYGTLGAGFGGSGSVSLNVPVGTPFNAGSNRLRSSIFGNDGSGNLTWASPGTYLVTFHTVINFTATSGTFTSISAALAVLGNFDGGPANDSAGTAAEDWAWSVTASGTSGSLTVSVVQFVYVAAAATAVKIAGSFSQNGALVWTASGNGNHYALWALRVA